MSNVDLQNSSGALKHNPQIDGLRFCCIVIVICYHWLPSLHGMKFLYFFGAIVNFFFVLSSYLITKILLTSKEKNIGIGIPKMKVIGVFLIRRTLRIFPAYYFFLLIVMMTPEIGNEIRQNAPMYFSYLANFYIFQSHQYPPATAHLWTLAVEEQFYILWPFLIIYIHQKHLLKTFLGIILSSVIIRIIYYYPAPGVPLHILTPFCLDAFAVGGLLAYKFTLPEKKRLSIDKYFDFALYAGIPLCVIIILRESHYPSFVFNKLIISLISAKIIEGSVLGYKNKLGKFLQSKFVTYLGRISYGIYLYHLLVPIVFWKLYQVAYNYTKINHQYFFEKHRKGISILEKIITFEGVYFIIYFVLVVAIASISWQFLEKPIMKMKGVFDYRPKMQTLNTFNSRIHS